MHDELERMIDEHGIEGVLRELATVLLEKADDDDDDDYEAAAGAVAAAADEIADETDLT